MKVKPGNGLIAHVFLPNVACITNYSKHSSEHPFNNMSVIHLSDGNCFTVSGDCDDLARDLLQEWKGMFR